MMPQALATSPVELHRRREEPWPGIVLSSRWSRPRAAATKPPGDPFPPRDSFRHSFRNELARRTNATAPPRHRLAVDSSPPSRSPSSWCEGRLLLRTIATRPVAGASTRPQNRRADESPNPCMSHREPAIEMLRAVRSHETAIELQGRFNPAVRRAAELVSSGMIGRPLNARRRVAGDSCKCAKDLSPMCTEN